MTKGNHKRTEHLDLAGLDAILQQAETGQYPPVERWNPPYCGEIGLKIGRDGTWFYQGSPIGRKRLVKLFSSVLRKDEDGRHYLVTPAEKIGIDVEDAPFIAVEMIVNGQGPDQQLLFRTHTDDWVKADADHPLRFEISSPDGGLKPYVRVRGRLEALVARAVYYDLVQLAVHLNGDLHGDIGVWSGGEFFKMSPGDALSADLKMTFHPDEPG